MRIRSNSTLSKLSDEQLDEIYERIASGETYRSVQKHCAQPPPDGFGILINLKTLCCYFKAERRFRHAEELAESKFDHLAEDNAENLLQNVKIELAHACYDLANSNDASAVNYLSRITHRIDHIKLDQQRVTIDQQRLALERDNLAERQRQFNFNAARDACIHALDIKETLQRNDIDLEDKVWKVRDIVFGPPPTQTPTNTPTNPSPRNEGP